MNGLLQDIQLSARLLVKSPGTTVVAVIALALGIGANTSTFSGVRALVLNPLPFHDLDRIVRVWDSDLRHGFPMNMVSAGDFRDWREQSRSFAHLAAFNVWNGNLTGVGEPERLQGAVVSPDLFPLLGMDPLIGRTFERKSEQPGSDDVVVLSYGLWQRRFGSDKDIVGRTIVLNERSYTVIGIMPRDFDFPIGTELWVPYTLGPASVAAREGRNMFVVRRLRDAVSVEQANAEMSAIANGLGRIHEADRDHGVLVRRIREVTNAVTDRFVLVGFAAAGFVLLLSCVNVTNLQLARVNARMREVAIRAALGASRWRIARQLLVENVMLASLGGAAGALMGWWAVDLQRASIPPQVYKWVAGLRAMEVNPGVLLFSAAAAVCAGVLCGLAPAWRAARQNRLADALKAARSTDEGTGRGRLRITLVVAEVALATVLLVAAGLLVGAFRHMAQLDVGFNPANLVTMQMNVPKAFRAPDATRQYYAALMERVRALPQVRSAAGNSGGVGIEVFQIAGQVQAKPGDPPPKLRLVTPGFFEAMGLPLIKGSTFTEQDAATTSRASIILSESAARRSWPSPGDPVGASATIKPYGLPIFTIIGIVGDTKDWFSGEPDPTVYVLNDQMPQWGMQLVARTIGDPAKALGMIQAQAQGGDRTEPIYDAKTMLQLFDEELSGVRLSAWMMGVFAVIALVLASSGVYGVVSYSVACRTREIGIRMALGAEPADVRRQVVMHALQLAGVGIAIGTAAALALTRVMSSVLYEVVALEAGTFVGVGLILAVSAFIAGYIPARRASSVDPIAALRDE